MTADERRKEIAALLARRPHSRHREIRLRLLTHNLMILWRQ